MNTERESARKIGGELSIIAASSLTVAVTTAIATWHTSPILPVEGPFEHFVPLILVSRALVFGCVAGAITGWTVFGLFIFIDELSGEDK